MGKHQQTSGKTLRQVLYFSRARAMLADGEIRKILWISQRNNRQRDITGCLLYSGAHFAQVLEGTAGAVEEVLGRIRSDDRHHGMVLALDRAVTSRGFPQWSMGILYKLELAGLLETVLSTQEIANADALGLLAEMKPDTVLGTL